MQRINPFRRVFISSRSAKPSLFRFRFPSEKASPQPSRGANLNLSRYIRKDLYLDAMDATATAFLSRIRNISVYFYCDKVNPGPQNLFHVYDCRHDSLRSNLSNLTILTIFIYYILLYQKIG